MKFTKLTIIIEVFVYCCSLFIVYVFQDRLNIHSTSGILVAISAYLSILAVVLGVVVGIGIMLAMKVQRTIKNFAILALGLFVPISWLLLINVGISS